MPTLRSRFSVPLSFWERFRGADPGLMAAAVAYNAFFALVPAAFAFMTAASFVGQSAEALRRTESTLRALLPDELAVFILDILDDVADLVRGQQGWIIAISLVIALWSGSRGVVALQKALGRIERQEEHRRGWRVRIIGIAITVGAGVAIVLVSALVIAGDATVEFLATLTSQRWIGTIRYWLGFPATALGVYLVLYAIYRWGPPQPIQGAAIAAAAGTVGAALTSWGFGWYLSRFGLTTTFGVLGAFAVALLWLYFTAYVLLLVAAAVGFGWRRREASNPE